MLEKNTLIETRDYRAEDRNFILATWLRGLYYGDSWFKEIPKDVFMENYHKILERIVGSPQVKIRVACLKDDPEVIIGYSVSRSLKDCVALDWVHVKAAWRRIGVAKSLMPEHLAAVTHLTRPGLAIIKQKCPHVVFNPFI